MKLGSEFRRQVYLVFKEAVNNMAKHSHCTEADIDLSISGGRFVLRLFKQRLELSGGTRDEVRLDFARHGIGR